MIVDFKEVWETMLKILKYKKTNIFYRNGNIPSPYGKNCETFVMSCNKNQDANANSNSLGESDPFFNAARRPAGDFGLP